MLPLHCDIQTFIEYAVAPYVGAWIETDYDSDKLPTAPRRTLRGCVDWNNHNISPLTMIGGRTLRGCVDWNK